LFKAQGTVWHQSDRKIGRIPEKLRNLDTDATWSKSGYHGWLYVYGIHLTATQAGFPVLLEVETAIFSEKAAIERKEEYILNTLKPDTFCGDDAYTKAMRIFRQGIENVRTHLGLGVLSLQIAMIANNIWDLPFRTLSHIKGVFA
jgi:hypothetical protein